MMRRAYRPSHRQCFHIELEMITPLGIQRDLLSELQSQPTGMCPGGDHGCSGINAVG